MKPKYAVSSMSKTSWSPVNHESEYPLNNSPDTSTKTMKFDIFSQAVVSLMFVVRYRSDLNFLGPIMYDRGVMRCLDPHWGRAWRSSRHSSGNIPSFHLR